MLRQNFLCLLRKCDVIPRSFSVSTTIHEKKTDDPAAVDTKKGSTSQTPSESQQAKQEQAKNKLKMLLESMNKEGNNMLSGESQFKLQIEKANKKIHEKNKKQKSSRRQIEPKMLEAVEKVSETFTKAKQEMKQNLLSKLEAVAAESEEAKYSGFTKDVKKTENLNMLLSSLKVETPKEKKTFARKEQNKKMGYGDTLYSMKPSDFFKKMKFDAEDISPKLPTWDRLYQKELELTVTHPPTNGFEQMIQWTRQGKLWHFPIDNEQGMEEEAQVGFHEHVFLDRHLEPWCPKRGPVRHFMELVTVGLSMNPYLTVAKKKEHIFWFRDFFKDQHSILVETGAIIEASKSPRQPPSLST